MIELDDLKKNWQNQKRASTEKFDIEKIAVESLSKLKKFEKKQFRINMFKTTSIGLILAYFIWAMLIATSFTVIKAAALLWILVSVIIFLTIYWKVQFKVNKLNVRSNSIEFIDEVLENFAIQKKLFKDKFWVFGAALIIGINILYLDLLKDVQIFERIGFHLLFCLIMTAVIWGGIKFRMLRFKKEYEPIINELSKIKADLKDTK